MSRRQGFSHAISKTMLEGCGAIGWKCLKVMFMEMTNYAEARADDMKCKGSENLSKGMAASL
jgi:hypothetical protein